MIFNILDNATELWMTKYIIGEIFSSGRATLYKNPSDQTVPTKFLFLDQFLQWETGMWWDNLGFFLKRYKLLMSTSLYLLLPM